MKTTIAWFLLALPIFFAGGMAFWACELSHDPFCFAAGLILLAAGTLLVIECAKQTVGEK